MMNGIWAGMLLTGILYAIATGNTSGFGEAMMDSCREAVLFLIGLSGIMAAWAGFMNIAEKSGLIEKIAAPARPLMRNLFSRQMGRETEAAMLMSFAANLFGAGNSATVFALKTMTLLDKENRERPFASDDMCMFLALNMSMIQLIPITILQIRSDAGALQPSDIILPSILAGAVSMICSVIACKALAARKHP